MLLIVVSLSVSAQGFYGDAGIIIGGRFSIFDRTDTSTNSLKNEKYFGIGMALDLKAGYGPFGNIPIYVVGEYSTFPTFSWIPPESIIRAGVIYYPLPIMQLGLSFGINILYVGTMWSTGFAWNILSAFDLGKRNHGWLIGLQYLGTLNEYGVEEHNNRQVHNFGVFVKYAYRRKI
jgi:hypothetical protein